ncbi:MAG TPA: dipeptidase [Candidatus Mediterraneibacter caccavium]|uniref:Dipeptidase n=1 Tax=Candidatus Mediterraneibacter caccavium TaxID=2838661 RepID=A0A9D1VY51_9FIRM|nr:dipeptidase [Candidatus Mediterraneibacter caccavium]
MKWIDLHCDTLSILAEEEVSEKKGGKGGLWENDLCVDIRRLHEGGAAAQFFACYVNAADFRGGFKDDRSDAKDDRGGFKDDRGGVRDDAGEGMEKSWRTGPLWDRAYRKALTMADYASRAQGERFGLARSAEEILRMERENRVAGVLTVEEGGVLNGRPERLEELYARGVRLITLTWNYENCIGSPNSRDPEIMQRGLTPFGIQTVERMNELGMIVDVSHLSDGGFWDCIKYSSKPIMASHSNARALCPHPRNLSDEMLHALGEKGGVAGVNFYGAFLRPAGETAEEDRAQAADIVRHIRYMADRAGEDAVALGTDFDGFSRESLPSGIRGVQDMGVLWDAMKRAGFTERQIEKTAYGNVMRVLRECMG